MDEQARDGNAIWVNPYAGRMDEDTTDYASFGLLGPSRESQDTSNSNKANPNPLVDHPAVVSYRGEGVRTDDLTSFIESFASLRASRVRSVGHAQYSHSKGQNFERFTQGDIVRELIEELADASNYIDFLAIKLLNLSYTTNLVVVDCD